MKAWSRLQDWFALVLGAWVFVSPWVLGVNISFDNLVAWTAWVLGALIVIVALWALAMPSIAWPAYVQILLAAALFVSPWVIGYTDNTNYSWSAWIVGVVLAAVSLWSAYTVSQESGVAAPNS